MKGYEVMNLKTREVMTASIHDQEGGRKDVAFYRNFKQDGVKKYSVKVF